MSDNLDKELDEIMGLINREHTPKQAAQILCERMLYQYVVNTNVSEQNANCITVYVLKNKRQITVDIRNAPVAFSIIKEAL